MYDAREEIFAATREFVDGFFGRAVFAGSLHGGEGGGCRRGVLVLVLFFRAFPDVVEKVFVQN